MGIGSNVLQSFVLAGVPRSGGRSAPRGVLCRAPFGCASLRLFARRVWETGFHVLSFEMSTFFITNPRARAFGECRMFFGGIKIDLHVPALSDKKYSAGM